MSVIMPNYVIFDDIKAFGSACELSHDKARAICSRYVLPSCIELQAFAGFSSFFVKGTSEPVLFDEPSEAWLIAVKQQPPSSSTKFLVKLRGMGLVGELEYVGSSLEPAYQVTFLGAKVKNEKPGSLSLSDAEGG